jgi:hypothetical protein
MTEHRAPRLRHSKELPSMALSIKHAALQSLARVLRAHDVVVKPFSRFISAKWLPLEVQADLHPKLHKHRMHLNKVFWRAYNEPRIALEHKVVRADKMTTQDLQTALVSEYDQQEAARRLYKSNPCILHEPNEVYYVRRWLYERREGFILMGDAFWQEWRGLHK